MSRVLRTSDSRPQAFWIITASEGIARLLDNLNPAELRRKIDLLLHRLHETTKEKEGRKPR